MGAVVEDVLQGLVAYRHQHRQRSAFGPSILTKSISLDRLADASSCGVPGGRTGRTPDASLSWGETSARAGWTAARERRVVKTAAVALPAELRRRCLMVMVATGVKERCEA